MKKKKNEYIPIKWNLNVDLTMIIDDLEKISQVLKQEISSISNREEKRYKKFVSWDENIGKILSQIQNIKLTLIPSIEQKLAIKFLDPNRIILALFTKTTKNIFNEMDQEYRIKLKHPNIFNSEKLKNLAKLGEIAEGLATFGDKALGLAAAHIVWEKGLFKKSDITREKEELIKNSKLALICRELNLYQEKISLGSESEQAKSETINHQKGTLVEAIFWIIYSENGLSKFINILNNF